MTAILELPEVRRRISPLSVEEYHRLGEFNDNGKRTELIRGILIEKMSKSPCTAPSPHFCISWFWLAFPPASLREKKSRSRCRTPSRSRTSQWCKVRIGILR